jgi:hypothetical protein
MADTKISNEIAASPLDGTEITEIVQAGNNRKATTQAIADLAAPLTLSGHSLSPGGSLDLAASDVSGLAAVATSGSASDLATGTLPNTRLSAVPNSVLAHSSITIAGHSVILGDSQTLAASDLSNGTTGSGNVVLADAPTISTSATVPTIYGGSPPDQTLWLQSTSDGSPSGDQVLIKGSETTITRISGGPTVVNIGEADISGAQINIAGSGSGSQLWQPAANASGTITFPSGSDTLAGLVQTQTFTGVNAFKDTGAFANVKAWGATGNGGTDDTTAIQNAINYMQSTYGGGTVYFPPGHYYVASGLTFTGNSVTLLGAYGFKQSLLDVKTNDVPVLSIVSDAQVNVFGMNIYGRNNGGTIYNSSVTRAAVEIGPGVSVGTVVIMRDCAVQFGRVALYAQCTDCTFDNCGFGLGWFGQVESVGANWYIRCKIDGATGDPSAYGWYHHRGAVTGILENHMVQCDYSGTYPGGSVIINDSSLNSVTVIRDGAFSSTVSVIGNLWTLIDGCETGGNLTVTSGTMTVVNCGGVVGVVTATAIDSGTVIKANNFNVS